MNRHLCSAAIGLLNKPGQYVPSAVMVCSTWPVRHRPEQGGLAISATDAHSKYAIIDRS